MAWAKLDDGFLTHPKALAAGKDGRALFIAGLIYAARELTDGRIARSALPLVAAAADVRGPSTALRLCEVGLWEDHPDGGWVIHDYHDYNPTAEAELAKRKVRSDAGRKGGQRSKPRNTPEAKPEANVQANGEAPEKQNGTPSPSPYPSDLRAQGGIREYAPSTSPPTPVDKAAAAYEHIAQTRPGIDDRGPGYLKATIAGLKTQHHQRAFELMHAHPDLTVTDLAFHLVNGTTPSPTPPDAPINAWAPAPGPPTPLPIGTTRCQTCSGSGMTLDDQDTAIPCPDCTTDEPPTATDPEADS